MHSICFRTHLFSTDPEGDLDLCNGQPGSDAALWAKRVLEASGIACREPMQEDYGWGFWLDHTCTVWVAVSYAGGVDGDEVDQPEWWIGAMHEAPFFALKQWKRRKEGRELAGRALRILDEAIRAEAAITVIRRE